MMGCSCDGVQNSLSIIGNKPFFEWISKVFASTDF